ncbi:MAG: tetratricopeptide repeat protein [Spirochaetes bacterium]|nr:tetratricopeptide repeat protein [Spirochaetota bacterium]
MMNDPLLSKAAYLAKRRDYEGALKLLKTEEYRYNGSFKYYYLYAVICLHAGIFVDAKSNFEFARRIKFKDTATMLGLAALYLKRMNTVQAVDYYLDVQASEPKNKIAKRALSVIRKYSSSDELSDWLTPERLVKLFPPIPAPIINARTAVIAVLIFAVVIVLTYGILVKTKVLPSPIKKQNTRPTAEFVLSREERRSPVETGGSYSFILTKAQATDLYAKALSLFTAYRDEGAKKIINRILESNASESLKNKSRLLLSYTEVPGFDNFKQIDNPSFSSVKAEPVIYRDVYVIWKGMATNVEITDDFLRFDFLVGYDTRTMLEGIVPVVFNNPVPVNPERPLELLGKITLTPSMDITLEGVAIHQSGRLEND